MEAQKTHIGRVLADTRECALRDMCHRVGRGRREREKEEGRVRSIITLDSKLYYRAIVNTKTKQTKLVLAQTPTCKSADTIQNKPT